MRQIKSQNRQQAADATAVQVRQGSEALDEVARRYAVAVTPDVRALMDPANPADPIARQYLPAVEELNVLPDERADPIGDAAHMPVKGIVHRYPDRVLLKPAHACAVYCRFCFRREMVGPGGDTLMPEELEAAFDYIRRTKAVWEVIVTGGDPFVLSPRRLSEIMAALNAITHVRVIRFHTRVPVAAADLVNERLIGALASEKAVYVALHVNHARELSHKALLAINRLVRAGVPLLSQTVLLKGVNDNVVTLEELFRALVAARVRPYYLHHLDPAPGTSHFRVDPGEGMRLMRELRGRVSGLCRPEYVIDIPGGYGKVPVNGDYVQKTDDGAYCLCDLKGQRHDYPF